MTPSLSQEASPASVPDDPTVKPITAQIHARFARFRDRHPHSSLTALLESGPRANAAGAMEYIVRAIISLEGQPFVSSLAAAASVEEAEDLARLRNLDLAEATLAPEAGRSAILASSASRPTVAWAAASPAPSGVPDIIRTESAPNQSSSGAYEALNDGLGDTLINLGSLQAPGSGPGSGPEPETAPAQIPEPKTKAKAKSKPKPKPAQATGAGTGEGSAAALPSPGSQEQPQFSDKAPPADRSQEFVADWSEDLAQIAVELKRLNWDSNQEQEHLQRNFNKASRDDIIDHSELLDYLGYLQALPSHFEAEADDDSPIADGGLSIDEADLQPQSLPELMANAGLKPASAIAAPTALPKMQASEAAPLRSLAKPIATTDSSPATPDINPAANPDPNAITREPVPETELADEEPDEPESLGPEELELDPELDPERDPSQAAHLPSSSLSRSEMMEETARLCKQLGWKNRQGSDFLQATYNKATRKDLTDAEMMDFLEQLRSLSTTEALPY